MARREDFDNSLWSDPDFLALTSDARLVYIWTWTNPRCGMAGIYKVIPAQAALETGLPAEAIVAALGELAEARFAYYVDNVLWVRSRVKHLRQKTKQIAVSIANDLRRVNDSNPLKADFLSVYGGHFWLKDYISGDGRVSLERPSIEPIHPPEPHQRFLGYGNGNGSGKSGKGLAAREQARVGRHEPDPDVDALLERLPGHSRDEVQGAVMRLRTRGRSVSVESVGELLTREAA